MPSRRLTRRSIWDSLARDLGHPEICNLEYGTLYARGPEIFSGPLAFILRVWGMAVFFSLRRLRHEDFKKKGGRIGIVDTSA